MPDTIVDVSPDMPFGLQMGGQNTGGRVVTVVCDPRERLRVYAASHLAGVWASGDGGRNWRQASRGLGTGSSCAAPPVLAVDPRNRRRLLYATFEDFRPGDPLAGLYLSTDAAGTWRRVPLPVAVDKAHGTVGFAVGADGQDHPWILTGHGLLIADTKGPDFDAPGQWRQVPGPVTRLGGPALDPTALVSDGTALIACVGNTVYRATVDSLLAAAGGSSSPWVSGAGLPADFSAQAMTLAPVPAGSRHPVLVLGTAGPDSARELQVWTIDVGVRAAGEVGRLTPERGSGRFVVGAPGGFRPDGSYDVIVGDTLKFFSAVVPDAQRSPAIRATFVEIPDLHRDPWSVAFPVDYASAPSPPPIYLAHDGGISVRSGSVWVAAMHGLHAYKSGNLAGVTVGSVDAIYLPSGDNDLWASRDGGRVWESMGGTLGDAGAAYVDPRLPGQVVAARNGTATVYRSADPSRAAPGAADQRYYAMLGGASGAVVGLSPEGGTEPPQIPGFAQILTPAGEEPFAAGDYLCVRNDADASGMAQIMRSSTTRHLAGGAVERAWQPVTDETTDPRFAAKSILAIGVSGGHRRPRVYALHSVSGGTELLRSDLDAESGRFAVFTRCSGDRAHGQPTRPKTLHVDPWDANVLYVWDDPDARTSAIRSSADGGNTWREEPALKTRATNHGEYTFTFRRGAGDIRCGPLQAVLFSAADPDLRVAVTFPGGLSFTRNAGQDWFDLGEDLHGVGALAGVQRLRDLGAYPYSGYLAGREGRFRLYVALLGRGLVRIDTALRTVKTGVGPSLRLPRLLRLPPLPRRTPR